MRAEGHEELFVSYNSEYFSAKGLTVLPKRTVTIKDHAAYGAIVIQGHGKLGALDIESPAMIRFGELTNDEVFVTANVAQEGLVIANDSDRDNLVLLKHFGPKVATT